MHKSSLLTTSRIQIRSIPISEEAVWAGSISLAIVGLMAAFPILFGTYAGTSENGPLEVLQFLSLGLGFGYLATKGIDRESDRPALYFGAILLLTLSLRELDLRPTQAPTWLVLLTHDLRHLWLTPIWAIVLLNAYRNRDKIKDWSQVQNILAVKQVGVISVSSFILATAFEKKLITTNRVASTFWEEVFELVFAMSLLALAVTLTQGSTSPTADHR